MSQAMSLDGSLHPREIVLWSFAAALVLAAHVAAAALLMRENPAMPSDSVPPAAIMIELAPEPEAVDTTQEQIAPDTVNTEEMKSEEVKPVEEPQPEPVEQAQPDPAPEPLPEPVPEMAEPPPPEPQPAPEPVPPEPVVEETTPPAPPEPAPEMTQTIPAPQPVEPPPEPVDPIEQQVTAALENVEVPLPIMRPPQPAKKTEATQKPEPRPKPARQAERPKQQEQAQKERTQAALQTRQSDRTAASQTSTGLFSQSVSPAKWKSRVEARIARNARKCPGGGTGTAAVRFAFDGSGNITTVSLSRSSGDSQIDGYIVAAVRRASPIPAPPSGVASYLDQALRCE